MKVMQGTVRSAKTAQTAIVTVVNRWQHPLYKKFVKHTKNYACHVEDSMKVMAGQVVTIQECRPMSKTKHFKVTAIVEGAKMAMTHEDEPAKDETMATAPHRGHAAKDQGHKARQIGEGDQHVQSPLQRRKSENR